VGLRGDVAHAVTSRPAADSERIAVSRPEPGPFTKTSTFCRPCSMPLRAAASAVTCAANGVDLREPLKPAPPADSHAMTLPSRSVSETIVLLNEVLMCACPTGMFFFGLRRPRWGRRGAGHYFLPAFFLPATCMRLGPCGCARWSWCSGRGRAARDGGGCRGSADLHQALDVLRALAAQVALDREVVDGVAQARDLVLGQVAHVRVGETLLRSRTWFAVDCPIP
jgi:hypothetical protein